MKAASTIARYLLGLMFVTFGLNGFLHFIPQPPPASPLAIQYFTAVSASHYMVAIFLVQLIGGVLLLVNRFVPLALVFLAGVIFNILLFHITMDPGNIGLGLLAAILWVLVFLSVRPAFHGIFQARTTTVAS